MNAAMHAAYLLAAPLFALWLCRNVRLARALGPVVFAYLLGMLLPVLPLELDSAVTGTLRDLSIPLAIPLLLFTLDVRGWLRLARPAVVSFGLCLLALLVSVSGGWLLFRKDLAQADVIGAMLVGVYSGGTPNMAVIHQALQAPDALFLQVNSLDVLISGSYFLFLISLAGPLYGLFLPRSVKAGDAGRNDGRSSPHSASWSRLALALLSSAAIVGLCAGLVRLGLGHVAIAPVMLGITSLAIAASFWPPLQSATFSYPAGYYLVLVFCCAVGSQVDLGLLGSGILPIAGLVATVFAGTVLLHLLLCRLFGIDRDTAIITQTASLFGPPFVPPVAGALRHPAMLLSGLTTGLVGYAVGNYLGLGMGLLFGIF